MLTFPQISGPAPLPPRLSMDEYIAFVQFFMDQADPEKIQAQKQLEEQIEVPFSFPSAP